MVSGRLQVLVNGCCANYLAVVLCPYRDSCWFLGAASFLVQSADSLLC